MNEQKIAALKELNGYITDELRAEVDGILDADVNRVEWWSSLDGYLIADEKIAETLATKGPKTFASAVKQGAKFGLLWGNGVMRIQVYGDSVSAKVDSKGLLQLIFKVGIYTEAYRAVVFAGETFNVVAGSAAPQLIHEPDYETDRRRENCIATYVVLRGPNVEPKWCVVDKGQIASSVKKGSSLYMGDDWQEMYKWLGVRKIVKELPEDPRLKAAMKEDATREKPQGSIMDRAADFTDHDHDDAPEPVTADLPDAGDVADEEV